MKRHKRRRKSNVSPHLIGNTGKICCDTQLHPLKMNRKYKRLLEEAEHDRKSKISQMSQAAEQYWEHCDLLFSLKRMNGNNCNSALIMELEERKLALKKKLIYLKSKIDLPIDETLKESLQDIFKRNTIRRQRKLSSTIATKHTVNPECTNTPQIHNCNNAVENCLQTTRSCAAVKEVKEIAPHFKRRTSWIGSVKSQIFIRSNNLQVIPISIDLFSTGKNLVDVLTEELGGDLNKYDVTFGTKVVDMNKTLFEQEIYHGTTVNLHVRLFGGGRKQKEKQPLVKRKNLGNSAEIGCPESWGKQQVNEWIMGICHEFEIEEDEVSLFKRQNGKALESLTKDDWIRRSPHHGDILFNQWQKLKSEYLTKIQEKNGDTDFTSVLTSDRDEVVTKKEDFKEKRKNDVLHLEENKTSSKTSIAGTFGEVKSLDQIENLVLLEELSHDGNIQIPEFGRVVGVTGVCTETQPYFDDVATLFIEDEPRGASNVSYKLKVVIRSNETSIYLQHYSVKTLLKEIRTHMQVAVNGRVERLSNGDYDFHEPRCEMIRFKLVIDSDNHGLVYVKRPRPQYTRQISQPWWIQGSDDASSAHWNLKVGHHIDKNLHRVFCGSSVSDDEIMNYVVAFKNCYDGEILVGVDKNGEVTGKKFSEQEMAKWREKLSMAIAKILPESNQGAAICSNLEEACDYVYEKKCFICVFNLFESGKNEAESNYIAWIHVPQGETARVYFKKPSDVHAFIRQGAENQRITNYEELFSSLQSLGSRRKPREIPEEDLNIDAKFKEAIGETGQKKNYKVLETVRYENQKNELKMVFGSDPTKTIMDKYITDYTCGFLNASGGTILFGVQEAEESKGGHIVGVVIASEKRRELLQKAVNAFSKFYPPVSQRQFKLIFHKVTVPSKLVVKDKMSDKDDCDKCILLRGPSDEISKKWPKFARSKLKDCLCRVVPVKPECFCIVVENQDNIPESVFVKSLDDFTKQNSKITKDSIAASDLKPLLKQLCMIELKIFPSQYPIHLIKPIDTHVFDKQGNLIKLSMEKLMRRFALDFDGQTSFDINKFLGHVEKFAPSGNSYILISSPFELATTERDLHGLVLPQWTLVIDFDQHLKKEGHLFHRFKELNDIHHLERQRSIKTPQDTKLCLNPEHVVCWLAARGYDEVEKTLSKEGHGTWNMTHRSPLNSLLKAELSSCVKPNYLNIVVLWDDGHLPLVDSLRTILEDILSINGPRTAVTFVCSTLDAKSDICENLVKPLQETYWNIIRIDRVYIAPPYVLSRYLSNKLPSPYQPEDDYQVPHRKKYRGVYQTFPDALPQELRNNISSYLKMMYMRKSNTDEDLVDKERKNFYSGAEITDIGLQQKFGIEREKMIELEKEFKILSNDKRSHVSMLCLKVDRGAGSTTLCLQFLYKYHHEYPCAQLHEISDKLLGYIRNINNATNLPLLLFVDEDISHPQDFLDFAKELVECRHVNVILLLIEPAEVYARKVTSPQKEMNSTRMKSVLDSSTLRTCPYKVVELRRELTDKEMKDLSKHLTDIKKNDKTSEKLEKLRNRSITEKGVRTFAHFGLTVFGQQFLGLKQFVKLRLDIANDEQKTVLSFLSLIHIFTDSYLPESALSGFLEAEKTVDLEKEFQNDYVRELLSPTRYDKDLRRISFLEVAEEILKQLAYEKCGGKVKYWQFIKDVSVDLAKHVLSVNICTKSIDKLTRRLFVTSEYESEKFSSLIRAMKEEDPDIARDTLTELVDVFENHSSFRAHIRAHLAKYHMIIRKDFEKAMPLIDEAVKDQQDDSLLRHIHGDIIRIHVRDLKDNPVSVSMDEIVSYAIKSSASFKFVRRKRPHDNHGYVSDAMVRITVMQAAIKKQNETLPDHVHAEPVSFVDYLVKTLDEIRKREDRRITQEEQYLLYLIPHAHDFLHEGVSDGYEHKEKWKLKFTQCIGPTSNLRRLCNRIREQKTEFHGFHDGNSTWLHEVLLSIQSLNNGFEIDNENLSPEEIEERIKEIEECASGLKCPERSMKFWIRYTRRQKNVPHLDVVKKRVKDWLRHSQKDNRTSPSAEFYNYVVHFLIALQDPNDREKRLKVEKLQQGNEKCNKKYKKDNVVIPQEWLHPKDGHHINSIDSLLHHEDLLKDNSISSKRRKQQPGREVIEGYLREKEIKKWKGTVTDIQKLWLGTITFKKHFEVRFIPQSVLTGMPQQGETVSFCLGFDRLGLSAWWVRREDRCEPLEMVKTYSNNDGDESSSDEEGSMNDEPLTSTSLLDSNYADQRDKSWDGYDGKRSQGVVVVTKPDKGFGYIRHPDILGKLFFHALQLVEPVITLKGTIEMPMVLDFRVEKLPDRTRATDIHVVKEEDFLPSIAKFRNAVREQNSSLSTSRCHKENSSTLKSRIDTQARETGVVVRHSKDKTYGFIVSENKLHGKDIFFHLRCLLEKGPLPEVGQRVQFTVVKTERGLDAHGVCGLPELDNKSRGKERFSSSPAIVDQPDQFPEIKMETFLETNEVRAAPGMQLVPKFTAEDNLSPKPTQDTKKHESKSIPTRAEVKISAPRPGQKIKPDVQQQIPSKPKPAEQENLVPKPTQELKQEPLQILSISKPAEEQENMSPKSTPRSKKDLLKNSSVPKPEETENSSPKPTPEIEQQPLQIPSIQKRAEQEQTLPKPTPEIKQEPLELMPRRAEVKNSAPRPGQKIKPDVQQQIPSKPKSAEQENSSPKPSPELKQEPLQILSISKPAKQENMSPISTPRIKQDLLQSPSVPKPEEEENSSTKPASEIEQQPSPILSVQKSAEQEQSLPKPTSEIKQEPLQSMPTRASAMLNCASSRPRPAQEIKSDVLQSMPRRAEVKNSAPRPGQKFKPDVQQQIPSKPKPAPEIKQQPLQISSVPKPTEQEQTLPKSTPEIKQEPLQSVPKRASAKPSRSSSTPRPAQEIKSDVLQMQLVPKPIEQKNMLQEPTQDIQQQESQMQLVPKPIEQNNLLSKPIQDIKQKESQSVSRRAEREYSTPKRTQRMKSDVHEMQLVPKPTEQKKLLPKPIQNIKQQESKSMPKRVSAMVRHASSAQGPAQEIKSDVPQMQSVPKPTKQNNLLSKPTQDTKQKGSQSMPTSAAEMPSRASLTPRPRLDIKSDAPQSVPSRAEPEDSTRKPTQSISSNVHKMPLVPTPIEKKQLLPKPTQDRKQQKLQSMPRRVEIENAAPRPTQNIKLDVQQSVPRRAKPKYSTPKRTQPVKSDVNQKRLRPVRDLMAAKVSAQAGEKLYSIFNRNRKTSRKATGTKERSKLVRSACRAFCYIIIILIIILLIGLTLTLLYQM